MKVKLAGYNVDADQINSKNPVFTPETISAAYARISRDPDPVDKLREKAVLDVEKARKSNEQIVFQYGHSSIAEHAVLNFDIIGISRLAIEYLEEARLASYTEKSQRYQKLKNDYIVPEEVISLGMKDEYHELINFQNSSYFQIYNALEIHLKKKHPNLKPLAIKNMAKEDARYVTSLAMEGQLGMTINARSLEHVISKLNSSPLAEVKELAGKLYNEAVKIIPSLIRHTEKKEKKSIKSFIEDYINRKNIQDVILLYNTPSNFIYNALTISDYDLDSDKIYLTIPIKKEKFVKHMIKDMTKHDQLPREFEFQNWIYKLNISAACFAQLKRHRMASIVPSHYNLESFTMPNSFNEVEMARELFEEVVKRSKEFYNKINDKIVGSYVIPQATNRRVLVQMNTRELFAFAKLRMDKHAQWDIRNIANKMVSLASKKSTIMKLACGKDEFDKVKKEYIMST